MYGPLKEFSPSNREGKSPKEKKRKENKEGSFGGRLWPHDSCVLTGHKELKVRESYNTSSCCCCGGGVPDICNCPPSSIAFAVGLYFFFSLFLDLSCCFFFFHWEWAGAVIRASFARRSSHLRYR